MIAHRLSTIMFVDNIIVLMDGQIDSQGTHEELLKTSLLYQSMLQAHIEAKGWSMKEVDTAFGVP